MRALAFAAVTCLPLLGSQVYAQDESSSEMIVVTGSRMSNSLSRANPVAIGPARPPVIGLRRRADSALRNIEIVSDSREEAMRKREVQATLLEAIDQAKRSGYSLVTGQFEVVEVTRANWQKQFPALAAKADADGDEDEDEDEDDDNRAQSGFEDNGRTATLRLKVKTKLDGTIDNAEQKVKTFVKGVQVTGRALIKQKGGLALTIIKPEQYRDEIYRLISTGAKHAQSFYGPDYSVTVSRLDEEIAWQQVSNTEVFLYIPYDFTVGK
jgi:uncharacterized protein YhbP (UPF0306 family)